MTGRTRRQVLRGAVVAGGTLLGGAALVGGLPDLATSAPSRAQDIEIMNFALRLESIQAALYRDAAEVADLPAGVRRFVETAARHEEVHVQALTRLLGDNAAEIAPVEFQRPLETADDVLAAAADLEDLTVEAYVGQAGNLTGRRLGQVAKIVSVDARHAAWARTLAGRSAAPSARDRAASAREVQAALAKLVVTA